MNKKTAHNKDTSGEEVIDENYTQDEDVVIESDDEGENAGALIKKLREKLKECEKESRANLDGWQRVKADYVNARKEEDDRRKDFIQFAETNLIEDLLPTLESFDMAMGNREAWENVPKDWRIGVEYIHSQLVKTLESRGLEIINNIDVKFDPSLHESVKTEDTLKSEEDGKIFKIMQKGYKLKGKVLRPAKVLVYKLKD